MIFHRFQCEFILKHKDCDCHSKLFTSTRPTDKKHSDLYVPITKLTSMTLCPNLEWLDHLLPKSPLLPPFSNLHDLLSNSSCDPTPNLPHLYLKLHSYYGQKILGIRRSQILDLSRSEIWNRGKGHREREGSSSLISPDCCRRFCEFTSSQDKATRAADHSRHGLSALIRSLAA